MVTLNHVFASHALYQQNASLTLRGGAAPGAEITARILHGGKTVSEGRAKADGDGRFALPLHTPPASLVPGEIVVSDGEELRLDDILFGELWIATGQSNMQVGVGEMPGHSAFQQRLRGLPVRAFEQSVTGGIGMEEWKLPFEPCEDLDGEWRWTEDPLTWKHVSALGAFVAAELAEGALKGTPVGIISCPLGGTYIECWLPERRLRSSPESEESLRRDRRLPEPGNHNVKEAWDSAPFQQSTVLYNLKIMPLRGLSARGVLWYQGECNIRTVRGRERDAQFRRMMIQLQEEYAELFRTEGQTQFPVVSSQLYPFAYGQNRVEREETFGYINEVFSDLAAEQPDKFACVPIYDISPIWNVNGNSHIHPMNKFDLGRRMAAITAACAYGAPGMTRPARQVSYEIKDGAVEAIIDTNGQALSCAGELKGFWISDADGLYREAEAEIVAPDRIRITSPDVPAPAHAAYQYHTMQLGGNVYAGELPLAPFCTDKTGAVRIHPKPWLHTETNVVWAHETDLTAYCTPVWRPEPGSEVCCDDVFRRSKGSLRVFGCPKPGAYTVERQGELMDLQNYSALRMSLFNLGAGKADLAVCVRMSKTETRTLTVHGEITPEEDNWSTAEFALDGLVPEGGRVTRIALHFAPERAAGGVWMDELKLIR